jgi:AmmeMemoRadiSam system protein A
MAHSPFTELQADVRHRLLGIARDSISYGLEHGAPTTVGEERLTGVLREPRGSFVTLRQQSKLRGCVGTIEPVHPLGKAVAKAAFNAAFRDTRFSALQERELAATSIEISVLSHMEFIAAPSEAALLETLEVGVDGLLLQEGWRRATFLPKVWEQLPDPADFLSALREKAGLPARYWSDSLRFQRYQAMSFAEPALQPVING